MLLLIYRHRHGQRRYNDFRVSRLIRNPIPQVEKTIAKLKKDMEKAARDMDFMTAARLQDEMFKMQKELEGMKG